MHVDVAIIGAGMSGLAAGIRLAYYGNNVCIFEKHYAYGGLNSYYTLNGRKYDVGLHAVTNFVSPKKRLAPLNKLFRQLRIDRDEFDLCEQNHSEIRFPGRCLKFGNDGRMLTEEVAREFPGQVDGFARLLTTIREFDDLRLDATYVSARSVLASYLNDPVLIDMLCCPVMYYGNPEEHDMDFTAFVTLFKSLILQGFARPVGGVRTIVKSLVRKFRSCGGRLAMRCGVERIDVEDDRVASLTLDDGREVTADTVFSTIGSHETMKVCPESLDPAIMGEPGRLSFVESIAVLDKLPVDLGLDATIVFFNDAERFHYAVPTEDIDLRSGVVCCPSNYERHGDPDEGLFRLTWLANYERWISLDESAYAAAKSAYRDRFVDKMREYLPDARERIVCTDMFTPRTIERYTGHLNGAVYGSPHKIRDGRTRLKNLFICGTDQGFLGIIGAMLSGISMANLHVLQEI